MANKHDWNNWDHYLQIHSKRLSDYDYFIVLDELSFYLSQTEIRLSGMLYCLSDIRIEIDKTLDVEYRNGRPFVRTVLYKYHALYAGFRKNLMRYDNYHSHPEHADEHHMHLYDLPAGHPQEVAGRVVHVGEDGWPTLSDFLDEVIERFHTG